MLLLWLRLECRLGTLHRPIHGLTKRIRLLLLLLCEWISLLLVEASKGRNYCLLDLGISSEWRRLHLLLLLLGLRLLIGTAEGHRLLLLTPVGWSERIRCLELKRWKLLSLASICICEWRRTSDGLLGWWRLLIRWSSHEWSRLVRAIVALVALGCFYKWISFRNWLL